MSTRRSVSLTVTERTRLKRLLRGGSSPARMQTRARILLLLDHSQERPRTDAEVAAAAFTSESTIKRLRRRFLQEGLESALHEKPRPGAKPKVTGEVEAQLFLLACSAPPEGHAQWSLRLLADRLVEVGVVESLSHMAVSDHLKKGKSSPGM